MTPAIDDTMTVVKNLTLGKRLIRKASAFTVLSLATSLAACGSTDEQVAEDGPTADSTIGSTDFHTETPTDEPTPDQPTASFDGIISLYLNSNVQKLKIEDEDSLGDHETEDTTVSLPDNTSHKKITRSSFSGDWMFIAYGEENIQIDQFDEATNEYVDFIALSPEEGGYSEVGYSLENPRFAPDTSTLWVEKVSDGTSRLASIDITSETDPSELTDSELTFEKDYAGKNQWTFDTAGEPMLFKDSERIVSSSWEDGEPGAGDYRFGYRPDEVGGVVLPSLATFNADGRGNEYDVIKRVSKTEFIMAAIGDMAAEHGQGAQETGAVLRMTIDPTKKSVDLEPLVPLAADKNLPSWVIVSPDFETLLFCHGQGDPMKRENVYKGYEVSLGSDTGEPEEYGTCSRDKVILEWR